MTLSKQIYFKMKEKATSFENVNYGTVHAFQMHHLQVCFPQHTKNELHSALKNIIGTGYALEWLMPEYKNLHWTQRINKTTYWIIK